jgi:dihydrofolate synthase/folylpolyglutamate synthase
LVLGPELHPDAAAVAEAVAERRHARIVRAVPDPRLEVGALGAFQRVNFSVAEAAAAAYLGRLDPEAVARAAAEVRIPGRLQVIGEHPLTLLDGAHNPDGMKALTQSLRQILEQRGEPGLVAVVSILDDKDAAGMLATLLPLCEALVLTRSQNPRALPPPTLQSLAGQLRPDDSGKRELPTEVVADPRVALERARSLATRDGGRDGVVLATGSIYLIADLLRPAGESRASVL